MPDPGETCSNCPGDVGCPGSSFCVVGECVSACRWDLDGDYNVGAADLLILLSLWDTPVLGPPDFNNDGLVGTVDFLEILAHWGDCPPAGPLVAFRSDRDGNQEIYVMTADGNDLVNLTNDAAEDGTPSWSSDGIKIAFRSDRDGNDEIYVMGADGSNLVNLTDNSAYDRAPAWSPDGSRIAFQSDRDGNDEIYVIDADGTDLIRLTTHGAYDRVPSWSLDGSRIAFTTFRNGNAEIYVMDADGSNQINGSPNDPADERYAGVVSRWQPDRVPV